MDHKRDVDDELTAALGELSPAVCPIDRDQLMYDAGRASLRLDSTAGRSPTRLRWVWPLTTAASLGVAIVAVMFAGPKETAVESGRVTAEVHPTGQADEVSVSSVHSQTIPDRSPPTYLVHRSQILAGRMITPSSASGSTDARAPQSPDTLLQELLEETLL